MTVFLPANNAETTLNGAITAGATSITIQTADQTKFPTPAAGQFFPVTLFDGAGNMEIVHCTARAGAVLTVARGQEGTTAQAWASGISAELRFTKEAIDTKKDVDAVESVSTGGTGATTAITAHDALVTKGSDIASASTINLTNATGAFIDITGTATITGITLADGFQRIARVSGTPSLTASSNLIVNGKMSGTYVCKTGDLLLFVGYASSIVMAWTLDSGVGIDDNATATKLTVTDTGLGIGETSPARLLDIKGMSGSLQLHGTSNGGYVEFVSPTSTSYIGHPAAISSGSTDDLAVYVNGAESIRFKDGGSVGIGANPQHVKFAVNGNAIFGGTDPYVCLNNDANSASTPTYIQRVTSSGLMEFYNQGTGSNGQMRFVVGAGTEIARMTSTGVGIVNSSPAGIFEIGGFSATGASEGVMYAASGRFHQSSAVTTSAISHWDIYNPNGLVGSVQSSGSGTLFNTTSDYRLKVTFGQITDATALEKVMQLPIYDLAFKQNPLSMSGDNTVDPESRQISALAHEIQALFPWAVTGEKDAIDEDGDPVWQMADPSKLVYVAFAAIQELKRENDALKSRIQAVEASLNAN